MKTGNLLTALLAACISCIAAAQETVKIGIEEMFSMADENNPGIKSLAAAVSAAEESVREARSGRLPSIEFSASASILGDGWLTDRDFSNGMNAPIPRFGNNFAIEAAWVIYAGGAISSGIETAELRLKSARAEAELNRQNTRFLLAGNYLELYRLDNQAEVYERNIVRTRRLLDDMRARQREGLVLRNDITRYELQLQRLELALEQTLNSRTIINVRLAAALGLEPGTRIEPERNIPDELPQILSEQAWQNEAENAPALRIARAGTELSKQGIKTAKAGRIPSLSVFAGDRLDGPITVEVPPLNKNLNYWYAGIGLKFDISSLYKSGKTIRRARYLSEQAEALEQQTKDDLRSDVTDAFIRLQESYTVWEMQKKNLELARQNYETVHNRFLNDLALITDMLDADSARLSAEMDVTNAGIGILFNWYRLRKAAGNL